jgi:hypothetical protein
MLVLNFTINPLFFPLIAFAPSIHIAVHFFASDAIAACSLKKQIKEVMSYRMTKQAYWFAEKHIFLDEFILYI